MSNLPNKISPTIMGQLIAEIMRFHGESKEDASRLATILLPHIQAYGDTRELEGRGDEIQRICDEVGLFTKKRNKFVYNVQLPIAYLKQRVQDLLALKDKTHE